MTYTIEQIKELCENATEGPWVAKKTTDGDYHVISNSSQFIYGETTIAAFREVYSGSVNAIDDDDAQFIAASRTIIPELVAEVEMLRGKLHAFKAAAQIVVDSHQMSCLGEDCQISGIDMLKYQLRHS